MSIEASIVVTLAEVEVNDEYQVELKTRKKLTSLTPNEAVQLAAELMDAAKDADGALRDDLARSLRRTHGFDIDTNPDPMCAADSDGEWEQAQKDGRA